MKVHGNLFRVPVLLSLTGVALSLVSCSFDKDYEITNDKLNMEMMQQALEILGRQHMTDVKVENREVTGNLKLDEAGRLILSIPYEKGWKVFVNGQETEPQTFGEAFIALDLEPGDYAIRLYYTPSGKGLGIVITIVSLLIAGFVFALLPWLKKRKQNLKDKTCNSAEV